MLCLLETPQKLSRLVTPRFSISRVVLWFVKLKLSQCSISFVPTADLRSALRSLKTLHVNDPELFVVGHLCTETTEKINKEKLLKTFVGKFLNFLLLFLVAFVGFPKNTFS